MNVIDTFVRSAKQTLFRGTEKTILIGRRRYRMDRFFGGFLEINSSYEPYTDNAFRTALAMKEGLFVDVGANVGQTLGRMLSMDPERDYLGFEPQVECTFYIQKFIEKNNLTHCTILPIGLSNDTCPVRLLLRAEQADSTASIVQGFRPDEFYSRSNSIYVATGDNVLCGMGFEKVAVIKIDVEGGELEVVEGFTKTLQKKSPFVFFEVLNYFLGPGAKSVTPEMIANRETRNARLMNFLKALGYRVFNTLPNNELPEIHEFSPHRFGELSLCNYVAVHSDCAEEFLRKHKLMCNSRPDQT